MQNFDYHNPTRVLFGEGVISQLGGIVQACAKKVLLVYGKDSIN